VRTYPHLLGQLNPDGSRVFPPGDMQVVMTAAGCGTVSITSGDAGNAGVAGATPETELGEGSIEGAAATVGVETGFGVALGDCAIAFGLADFVGFELGLLLAVGDGLGVADALETADGLAATDGLALADGIDSGSTVAIGFAVISTSGGSGIPAPASFTLCSGANSWDS